MTDYWNRKISLEEAKEAKELWSERDWTLKKLSEKYGVSSSAVYNAMSSLSKGLYFIKYLSRKYRTSWMYLPKKGTPPQSSKDTSGISWRLEGYDSFLGEFKVKRRKRGNPILERGSFTEYGPEWSYRKYTDEEVEEIIERKQKERRKRELENKVNGLREKKERIERKLSRHREELEEINV